MHIMLYSLVDHEAFLLFRESINIEFMVPSRISLRQGIMDMSAVLKIQVEPVVTSRRARVSSTAEEWSSDVYKGNLIIAAH